MNKKSFRNQLSKAFRQAIPDDVDLWPAVRYQLLTQSTLRAHRPSGLKLGAYRMAAAMLTVVGLLLIAQVTPQGRAWAQGLFRFFSVTSGESLPLSEAEIEQAAATAITVPTFAAVLVPVTPESTATHQPTALPSTELPLAGCGDETARLSYRCQVSQAEVTAGFAIKVPPTDLQGLVFNHASANPVLQLVTLEYSAIGGGTSLSISQSPNFRTLSQWDVVPPSAAVESIMVGTSRGEYLQGIFGVKPGSTSAVWDPEASVRRLRWSSGNVIFQMRLDGHVERVEWLDKDTLVELASSLVSTSSLLPSDHELRADYLTSFEDAQLLTSFDLQAPGTLPEGFVFKYAAYDIASRGVKLVYEPQDQTGVAALLVFQTPAMLATHTQESESGQAGTVEEVAIGNYPGEFWSSPEDGTVSVRWIADDIDITLVFFPSQWTGLRLAQDHLIAIAESMK